MGTPDADPFDGKLTFVYGSMSTRLQILRLLPRTMKPHAGSYIEHPNINQIHSTWLKIHTEQPTPLHADGEIQSDAVHDIEYRIVGNKLPVLLPK
jgi:diacylglycerol kinase family enzyme